jgi:hypothetical protein
MAQKITALLKAYIIEAGLGDAETVQVWDEAGTLATEQLPFVLADGDTVRVDNHYEVTVFVDQLPLAWCDHLKLTVGQFIRHYGREQVIEFEFPRLDAETCQALFYFELDETMSVTKTAGVLSIDYCNVPIETLP